MQRINPKQSLEDSLVQVLDVLEKDQSFLVTTDESLLKMLDLMQRSNNGIKSVRRNVHTIEKELEGQTDSGTLGAQFALAQLDGRLSPYGVTYAAAESVVKLGIDGTIERLSTGKLLEQVRQERQTWFGGVQSLENNVTGLYRVREAHLRCFELLEPAFNMIKLQAEQDAEAAGDIIQAMEKVRASSQGMASGQSNGLSQWAQQTTDSLSPVAKGDGEIAAATGGVLSLLASRREEFKKNTLPLDDLANEIKKLKK